MNTQGLIAIGLYSIVFVFCILAFWVINEKPERWVKLRQRWGVKPEKSDKNPPL